MISLYASGAMRRLRSRFETLYGEDAAMCLVRMAMLVGRYGINFTYKKVPSLWDQRDSVLITYGDSIRRAGEHPLATLKTFADDHLQGAVRTIHILPFFPYSSDDGFSVIHYRTVNPDLGTWDDVQALHANFDLMFDLVLNHVSRHSGWFRDYELGIAPGRDYFIDVNPAEDLSAVVRPRSLPLLTKIHTRVGEKHVWTTFSADQIDLDFSNPDVLFEILDILLLYVLMGARIIRLDAIAYLWKKIGTSCIHLDETHQVVKIFRDFLRMVAPHVILLTETNVPHEENISYFGKGDEAHMVYQFSMPPLVLHAALSGKAKYLTRWAAALQDDAPNGCTYFNFTASHDGVGVRPLEGLVPDEELEWLVGEVKKRGGAVSTRRMSDGSDKPYELNITYYDAVSFPSGGSEDLHAARFLATQAVPIAFKGIPGIYINSIVATPNDHALVEKTKRARSINRTKWDYEELEKRLQDPSTPNAKVLEAYLRMLRIRGKHKAFHPDGSQRVLELDDRVFAIERLSPKKKHRIVAATNFSGDTVTIPAGVLKDAGVEIGEEINLFTEKRASENGDLTLSPYETCWVLYG